MHALSFLFVLLSFALSWPTHGAILPGVSFNPPFTAIHPETGDRMVSGYTLVGDAITKKSFVRLTPDRLGRHGSLWSDRNIGSRELAANLQFRISGQERLKYGEGITLWIAQPKGPNPTEGGEHARFGSFYGLEPPFLGIGVILTTHHDPQDPNAKDQLQHRHAVMVVVNDGTKTNIQDLIRDTKGRCEATLRYFEKRADFSVTNTSRIRVAIRPDYVTVSVDETNKGVWTTCAEVSQLGLPPDWIMNSRIGITANTETLADNHDVLSLKVFDMSLEQEPIRPPVGGAMHQHGGGVPHMHTTPTPANQHGMAHPPAPHDHPGARPPGGPPGVPPSPHIPRPPHPIMGAQATSENPIDNLVSHLEHQLTSIHEGLRNSLQHLKDQELKSETRIDEIERSLGDHVTNTLHDRLKALEDMNLAAIRQEEELAEQRITALEKSLDSQVQRTTQERLVNLESQMEKRLKSDLESRISSLEHMLDKRVEQRLGYLEKMVADKITRSVSDVIGEPAQWKTPFAILAVAVIAVLGIVMWKFFSVQKQHAN